MKRIIAILLALLCLFALVSCGGNNDKNDPVLQDIIAKFGNAVGDNCEGEIVYKSQDGTTVFHSIIANLSMDEEDKAGNKLNILEVPYYEYVSMNNGLIEMPEEMEGTIDANPDAAYSFSLSNIEINTDYFEDNVYTFENNKFHAVIVDCEGFFGIEDMAQETVDFTMTIANGSPKKIMMNYETPLGYLVEIELKFNY